MVPSQSSNFHHLAMMTKNLTVPANTSLEVFFTCIAIGWKDDVIARMNNPILQVNISQIQPSSLSGLPTPVET